MGTTLLLLLSLSAWVGPLTHGAVVDTKYGPVNGHTVPVYNGVTNSNVEVYYAIPYGQSTTGNNRYRNPVEPDPWTEVFQADTLGQACPQNPGGWVELTHSDFNNYGEDCLNINIFTPSDQSGAPYPVLVWFHGGGYTGGTNIQYSGHFLAAHGLVVVTANYRLGNMGYAYTADGAAPGNVGLWDQRQSLIFVQENIANFGGDPSKVTISGQSAGASSTSLHMMSPASKGLFSQCLMESGTETAFWAVNWPAQNPETYTTDVAGQLGCPTGDTFTMMDCLRVLPWQDIVNTTFRCTPGHFCQGMAPVIDGPGGFLPDYPQNIRASGNFSQVPTLSGLNLDDGSLYTLAFIPSSILGGYTRDQFLRYINNRILGFWSPILDNTTKSNAFEAVNYNYSPWPYVNDTYANRHQMNQLITDIAFGMPWDRQVKNQSLVAPTYAYVFGFRGRNSSDFAPEWMGVPHSGEIPYVWGWPLLQLNPAVRNDSKIFNDFVAWTDEDIAYTVFWNTLYANFVKFGNPTPQPVTAPNNLGDITWSNMTLEELNVFYLTNVTADIIQEYRQQDFYFWSYYMSYIVGDAPIPLEAEYGEYAESWEKGTESDYIQRALRSLMEGDIDAIYDFMGDDFYDY